MKKTGYEYFAALEAGNADRIESMIILYDTHPMRARVVDKYT
jgi:hypothetical protein